MQHYLFRHSLYATLREKRKMRHFREIALHYC
jgi:hypothetical protein